MKADAPTLSRPAGPFSAWERSLAVRYLRAKKSQGGVALISIISFVGIMLAVAVLISVMSIMNGFRSELTGKMLGFNGHIVVDGAMLTPERRAVILPRLRATPDVTEAAPVVDAQALIEGPAGTAGVLVRGVEASDLRRMALVAENVRPKAALDSFGLGEEGGEGVIIGSKLAEALAAAPGQTVTLVSPSGAANALFGTTPTRKTYTVLGTFQVGMSQYDQSFLFMPLTQAQLLFGRDDGVDSIQVKVRNPDKASGMKDAVRRAVGPARIRDWTESDVSFQTALAVERTAMRIILSLIVIVAAMNIISGLVMLVKNKSRDIAILRTIGAGRGSIMRVFFMTGAMIGVSATLAGLLLGVVFCLNIEAIQDAVEAITNTRVFPAEVYFLTHVPALIEWSEVGWVSLCALAASFLAALPQALHASRLDPVEALRYE